MFGNELEKEKNTLTKYLLIDESNIRLQGSPRRLEESL